MLSVALALFLSQTSPAIRRTTPASDDPGMVVRPVGTTSVNCTNCGNVYLPDGGNIGSVMQGRALDGGTGWGVYIEGGNLSVTSSTSFDGGSIGYLRMPDGGPLEVYTVNAGSSGGGGWVPDGGFVGSVGQGVSRDGGYDWGVTVSNVVSVVVLDGGFTGTVAQGAGQDGGAWNVTNAPSAPLYVIILDGGVSGGGSSSGWVPDGGYIGLVGLADGGGVFVTNSSIAVTGPLTDAQLRATAVPISAASLPLPSGAATEATLSTRAADSTITARLNTLGQKTSANSAPVVLSSDQSVIPINDNGGSLTVDGTVAVSGTVTTSGTTTASQGTPAATANRWPVQLTDGTDLALVSTGGALLTDSSATTQPVSAASLPLPTGAATSAAQTTGNASLSSIDGKTPALVSGRVPVDGSGVTQPVSGSVTVTQATGTNLHVVVDSAPTTTVTGTVTANAGTGPWPVTDNGGSLTVDGTVAATQSGAWNVTNISGTVSLPTGAATEATLGTRLAESTFTGRFPASASLADTTVNPSLSASASYLMGYNGTTWDRLRKSASGLLVDIQNTSLAVTQSGTWNVGQSGTWTVGVSAGTNYIGKTRLTDGALDVTLLNSAPGSDTGQVAMPVRIISSLAGGAGGTSSSFGSAFPASGTAAGFNDGTNMSSARTYDTDSGGGTQNTLGVSMRVSASGGSAEAAAGAGTTSTSTLRVVLPTDQTAIPVTDNGSSLTVDGTVALSGTSSVNVAQVAGTTTTTGAGVVGSGTQRVVLATDQSVIPINDNGGSLTVDGTVAATQSGAWNITNVSGTVSLPTGAATETTLGTRLAESTFTGRFPTAGALSDATANPTTTGTAVYLMGYNGTTWDRIRSSTSLGITVNISNTTLAATQSGTWNVGLSAGTNYVGKVRQTDGTLDLSLLNSAPGSDTGQVAMPVRIISSLAAGGSGGGTSSNFGAAFPAAGTAAGFSDGTNMETARVFDADTGGGAQNVLGTSIRVSASGGSAEAAAGAGTTSTSTLRVVLPTDQTAIPVTDNGTSLTVDGTVALSGTSAVNVSQVGGNAVNVGSGAAGTGTQRVILATDQPVIPVSDNGGSLTVDGTVAISGTVAATQSGTWSVRTQDGSGNALASSTAAPAGTEQALIVRNIPNGTQTISGTVTANAGTGPFPVSDNGGSLTVDGTVAVSAVSGSVTVAQATAANLRAQTASESATGSAVPATAAAAGWSDGTSLRIPRVYDTNNDVGTEWTPGVQLRAAVFGGSQGYGFAADGAGNLGLATWNLNKLTTTVVSTAITCATTATAAPTTPSTDRTTLTMYNNSSVTIYIGGSGVTTSNGIPLLPGASFTDDTQRGAYYCRVASGTADLRVMEQ